MSLREQIESLVAEKDLTLHRDEARAAFADLRRALSDGDGRVLRGARIRAHLRICAGCRRFR